jgi:hypothetical protein
MIAGKTHAAADMFAAISITRRQPASFTILRLFSATACGKSARFAKMACSAPPPYGMTPSNHPANRPGKRGGWNDRRLRSSTSLLTQAVRLNQDESGEIRLFAKERSDA